MNWDHASATVANAVTSGCTDGYIQLKCGGVVGAATNVIIDVLGYYEPLV